MKRGLEIRRLDAAGTVVGQSTAEGTEGSKTMNLKVIQDYGNQEFHKTFIYVYS